MIDEVTTSAVRDRIKKLLPYRRQVRPASPASFAPFVDSEFQRIDGSTREIVASLKALDPLIAALPELGEGGGAAFPEAPTDGLLYGRKDAAWAPVKFSEAPLDGQLYARKSGNWTAFEPGASGGGVDEAPADGREYVRKDGSWVPLAATGGGPEPHGKHKYWRLVSMDQTSQGYALLAGLIFRSTPGGQQMAIGGRAIASGNSSNYVPANAFDGNPATCWESQSGSGPAGNLWIGYEFTVPVTIVEAVLQTHPTLYPNERPLTGWISYSDDGANWTAAWPFGRFTWTTSTAEMKTSTSPFYRA